jgi:hypothetical protein
MARARSKSVTEPMQSGLVTLASPLQDIASLGGDASEVQSTGTSERD